MFSTKQLLNTLIVTTTLLLPIQSAIAAEKPTFRVAWSIYVGWMPWEYAGSSGILDRWADRYGIKIELVQINDYIESINQYTAGQFDAVTATNMDILTIAAASGVDTTALIVGDYSNGNDAILLRDSDDLGAIRGQRVHLVELSVSHYLLARALNSIGLAEKDVTVVNMAEADIVTAWASGTVPAAVTWNPMVMQLRTMQGTKNVFDSSQTPGEILDLTVVKSDTLAKHPELGKALVGAWYEAIAALAGEEARAHMAAASGTTLASFDKQLETTHLFATPASGVAFVTSDAPRRTMQSVAEFSFEHGLLGPAAPDPGFVGIAFPDGTVWGDSANVQLRFTDTYMRMAADDKL